MKIKWEILWKGWEVLHWVQYLDLNARPFVLLTVYQNRRIRRKIIWLSYNAIYQYLLGYCTEYNNFEGLRLKAKKLNFNLSLWIKE